MDLYPAIDLCEGKCVRLRQGDFAPPDCVRRRSGRAGA